jgi:hypothetical protein
MARKVGGYGRVYIDGHEIGRHVLAIDLKLRPGHMDVLVLELADATAKTDPETGILTFRIGTPNDTNQTSTTA